MPLKPKLSQGEADKKSTLLVFVLIFEIRNYIWIRERRHVTQCASFGDIAKESTHDFSRPCFWKISGE
jgi:hypothetical protein